jgi:hypothetical protein
MFPAVVLSAAQSVVLPIVSAYRSVRKMSLTSLLRLGERDTRPLILGAQRSAVAKSELINATVLRRQL